MNNIKAFVFLMMGIPLLLSGLFAYFGFSSPNGASGWPALIPAVLGVVFVMAGVVSLMRSRGSSHMHQELQQRGQKIAAVITGVDQDTSIAVNRRFPYVISAKWTDPATSKAYQFNSGHIWVNPVYNLQGITAVDVYIDPADPTKYFMDTASVGIPADTSNPKIKYAMAAAVVMAVIVALVLWMVISHAAQSGK